jgi:hypothetical protein
MHGIGLWAPAVIADAGLQDGSRLDKTFLNMRENKSCRHRSHNLSTAI